MAAGEGAFARPVQTLEIFAMKPHPGIRIDAIRVDGAGGLIVAVGMTALLVLAVPGLVPLVAACAVGGVCLAPLLHRVYY
jgi:hypothetical protein